VPGPSEGCPRPVSCWWELQERPVLREQSWLLGLCSPPAPWQRPWLALSQGLSSMGGRPFRGSEAWEMFIAWPQRHWKAARERRRAKAAQAALRRQISSSKGQGRGGEEKPLPANAQLRKLCLSQPEIPQPRLCRPRGRGMPGPGPAVPCRSCRRDGRGHR